MRGKNYTPTRQPDERGKNYTPTRQPDERAKKLQLQLAHNYGML